MTAIFLNTMYFQDGMTVAELKAMIRDWPENDDNGNPCEVLISDADGFSNQVRIAAPQNMVSKDGKVWANFMLGHK